ncbi:MAG: response regulator [Kurthia sp.]|nr:response regulator [Candidatus Kurthia equi]
MIRVLLIEDDPMIRKVHSQFISKIEGVEVVGEAENGLAGMKQLIQLKPDIILLDIFMPIQNGIETLQQIRDLEIAVDIVVITAANDMYSIEKIIRLGVFDYILKPFSFERMKQTFSRFIHYKNHFTAHSKLTQQELDRLLHPICEEANYQEILPKGLNRNTLSKILQYIEEQTHGVTAIEVAVGIGMARVTARRYLDYLEKQNKVRIESQYGGVGRPINQYCLL